jgi:hypothetical protein
MNPPLIREIHARQQQANEGEWMVDLSDWLID